MQLLLFTVDSSLSVFIIVSDKSERLLLICVSLCIESRLNKVYTSIICLTALILGYLMCKLINIPE